ncbi:hypothetical protein PFHG_03793 [Plasmodium falciparum HB3]|uniref:Uncharacterized protein n=7 Tax=Plasmodium falciparum TaxID=5833 RepID=Q8ID17_PLAF7|nr:conserved Plasmodium protein, unknown function [Plasmodium falciparum 3D7]ETW40469.1 hypothetical protein PFNF135_05159 [Plasmodium falciparum NF135/5.C10]EUR65403.1 hypothetical protein PFBG_05017 [Plasmodium falciparum 7G8]KAF4326435.1 hypothetical protein CYL21_5402 [Plasmodium falciparum NF54]KOB62055.1 hypothetical protein PFHG_03793 [Plasmodium falciparum HB3]CAD52812.1 conserved Plasmodium protein, unknown function [Plasmodium falciparum 3D7]|eukprot:XP_001350403.1 conserved Plasmodium protein, unknown function [Plasmodium falciparum 3D7]
MKCPSFSCKSKYYHHTSKYNYLSDDDDLNLFLKDTQKKKNFNYLLEKAVNNIIYETKKNCDISSDVEQIEKLNYENVEESENESLDDIDIILKKSKSENMFLKNKNNQNIYLPPKNIKHRIYSTNQEENQNVEKKKIKNKIIASQNDKIIESQNDKIIENFKNVLCNDINQYFKDIFKNLRNNNLSTNTPLNENIEIQNKIIQQNKNFNISNETSEEIISNTFKNNSNNYSSIMHNNVNSYNNSEYNISIKDTYVPKNLQPSNDNKAKSNTYRKNKYTKKNNKFTSIHLNNNNNSNNKLYTHHMNHKKKKKKKKKNSQEKISNHQHDNIMDQKKNFFENKKNIHNKYFANSYIDNNTVKSFQLISNVQIDGISKDLINSMDNLNNWESSKDNCNETPRDDFTFNHFQKNKNNNILNKLRF